MLIILVIINKFPKPSKVQNHTRMTVWPISITCHAERQMGTAEQDNYRMRAAEMKFSRKPAKFTGCFDNKKSRCFDRT